MNTYTLEIRNAYEDHRTIEVESGNPQDAHKQAFFELIKSSEEIVNMVDSKGNNVFSKEQGFNN